MAALPPIPYTDLDCARTTIDSNIIYERVVSFACRKAPQSLSARGSYMACAVAPLQADAMADDLEIDFEKMSLWSKGAPSRL